VHACRVTGGVLLVRVLFVVGLGLLAGGVLLGFLPRSAGGVDCGSAFRSSDAAAVADYGRAIDADRTGDDLDSLSPSADRCSDARSTTRGPAVVLITLGAAGVAAGLVVGAGGRPLPD
jgi:hypothetical protein